MIYPRLKKQDVSVFITEWMVRADLSDELVTEFFSAFKIEPGDLDLQPISKVAQDLYQASLKLGTTGSGLDQLEINWSVRVFEAFQSLPLPALGDREFWSYCSARYFWGFISLRQHTTVMKGREARLDSLIDAENPISDDGQIDPSEEAGTPAGLMPYVVGNNHYQIPLRLYLRGQAVGGDSEFLEKNQTDSPVDFWRSQLLGVRTSAYPNWTRPIVEAQSAHNLPVTGTLRSAGRTVNRLRANVSPILHEEAEAKAIVDPIWTNESGRTKTKNA